MGLRDLHEEHGRWFLGWCGAFPQCDDIYLGWSRRCSTCGVVVDVVRGESAIKRLLIDAMQRNATFRTQPRAANEQRKIQNIARYYLRLHWSGLGYNCFIVK